MNRKIVSILALLSPTLVYGHPGMDLASHDPHRLMETDFSDVVIRTGSNLANLELSNPFQYYFGPWYDRLNGDTPVSINNRLGHKCSFFQSDVNISSTLQSSFVDNFFSQVAATKSDAIAYLTVYPMEGFDQVSDAALDDLSQKIVKWIATGRRLFLRYAPEMNGNWFRYGQQPTAFKESWTRVIGYLRKATNNSEDIAFIWSPNSGNGYPFNGGPYMIPMTHPDYPLLDTSRNGTLGNEDDPYTPYYPGDEWVDWVGFSIYHYGPRYPWEENTAPEANKVEAILTGQGVYGPFNFYRMFAGDAVGAVPGPMTKGSKPFFISETGSTYHLSVTNRTTPPEPGPGRVEIKRTWWRQLFDPNLIAKYPKIKAIGTFEFIKFEETSWRDFTIMGDTGTGMNSPFGNDGGAQAGPVLEALKQDLELDVVKREIVWAGPEPKPKINLQPSSKKDSSASHGSSQQQQSIAIGLMSLFSLLWIML